jgi:hypothetical protein
VPQNAASAATTNAAATTPGDAIPSRPVFSSHLGFSAAARRKRPLQLEGLGMVVLLSERRSSLLRSEAAAAALYLLPKDVTCASLNKARRPVRAPHTPTTDPSAFFSFYFGLFKLYFEK